MRRPPWLDRESESWQRDGLITAEQRAAILTRYPAPQRTAAAILTWLAVLTGGAGLVLLVGWNWDRIPRDAQLGVAFAMPVLAFIGALAAERGGRELWTRRLVLLGALSAGGIFAAVSDVYHSPEPGVSVLGAIALCASAALVPAPFLTSVAGGVTIVWLVAQTGLPPAPWIFLLLGALLAIAVEQAPDAMSSAVVTAAIAVWAFAVVGDTWPNANGAMFVFVLLAASAVDGWAHAPAGRRPAFASPVAAAVFAILPLAFLQVGHGTVGSDPWADATANPWAALALAVVMAAVAIWPAISRRASVRSAFLAVLGLAWLGTWLFSPAAVNGPDARWPWTLAFGLATVLAGVSYVREAARERSAGLFAMGVLAVATFVVVRVVDAQGALWQSALALFGGAVLLAWLGRAWAKRP